MFDVLAPLVRHVLLPRWTPLLRDPRDVPLLDFGLRASIMAPAALATLLLPLVWPALAWPLAVAHFALYAWHLERFITWFHDVNHHRLFPRERRWADHWFRVVIGGLHGCTPATYFCQHVLMHHPTNNLADDDSTTMPYRRDSPWDFVAYVFRFWKCQLPLARFLRKRYPRQPRFARSVLWGDFGGFAVLALLLWLQPVGAAAVFLLPLLVTRNILLVGNWGEHPFIDPAEPGNLYRSSTSIVGPANDRCFNVGHHIGHHVRPGLHFSALPGWFDDHRERLGHEDAIVLRDLVYPDIWWFLMTQQWGRLADHYVPLPGAPDRTREELIAMFQHRVQRIPAGAADA